MDIKHKTLEVYQADPSELEEIEIVASESSAENLKGGQIDPILKHQAKDLYMRNHKVAEISSITGIKKGTLLAWMARERWADDRKEANSLQIGDLVEGKKLLLNSITSEILEGILKAVRKSKDEDGAFKSKELPIFLAAAGNLEKLARLSMGQATSISEERSKRAQFTIPLEHLQSANSVKVADPFSLPNSTKPNDTKPHPEEGENDSSE